MCISAKERNLLILEVKKKEPLSKDLICLSWIMSKFKMQIRIISKTEMNNAPKLLIVELYDTDTVMPHSSSDMISEMQAVL